MKVDTMNGAADPSLMVEDIGYYKMLLKMNYISDLSQVICMSMYVLFTAVRSACHDEIFFKMLKIIIPIFAIFLHPSNTQPF